MRQKNACSAGMGGSIMEGVRMFYPFAFLLFPLFLRHNTLRLQKGPTVEALGAGGVRPADAERGRRRPRFRGHPPAWRLQ